jgi:RNA polymerase sigma-70 factor (ECF subfamily)
MFSRLHQYQGDAPLTHWVSRLAVTTCCDRLRAKKRHREICWTDLTAEESDVLDPDWLGFAIPDASDTIQARDLVNRLLSSLSPDDRNLLLQVASEGVSLEAISKRLGWGISRIKIHIFRMRARLRETLHEMEKCR